MKKTVNLAKDSFTLIFVQCMSLATSMLQSMVLARKLTQLESATYQQGLLIISVATTVAGLGLAQVVNYFYNKSENPEDKKTYTATVFFIAVFIGLAVAALLCVSTNLLSGYFHNTLLRPLVIYLALRPLFANLISIYQTLYVSNHMTKIIAIRVALISVFQVTIITLVSFLNVGIAVIFQLLLLLDIVQLFILSAYFRKKVFKIPVLKFNSRIIKPIINYAVPLALSVLVGNILKDMDKLMIGNIATTEDFALYGYVSKPLPFTLIGGAFTTVVMPVIIKLLNIGKKEEMTKIWSNYLQIGYVTTWTLCAAALVSAGELLHFLYSDLYAGGLNIFMVYILVELFRFSYFGIILSAKGKTNIILAYSVASLLLNFVLNITLYKLLGLIGPAFATLISVSVVAVAQLLHSIKLIDVPVKKVIEVKTLAIFLAKLIVVSAAGVVFKYFVKTLTDNFIIVLVSTSVAVTLLSFVLNLPLLKKNIQNLKYEETNANV